ncbi:MAG TPA: hypothetical protein ACHBX0_14740 [Arsenophonus sp.]
MAQLQQVKEPNSNLGCSRRLYTAEIKGDDPFVSALLSKAGASGGYATGNIIKVPMDEILDPVCNSMNGFQLGFVL